MATVGITMNGKEMLVSAEPASSHVVSSPRDVATLLLNDAGLIVDCNPACQTTFGYSRQELCNHHVSVLLPKLEGTEIVTDGQINPRLRFLCRCAVPFVARRRDGTIFASEVFLSHISDDAASVRITVLNLGVRHPTNNPIR